MMGDVPVGVLLSGGLDSSLVAAIAARWARRRGLALPTFAVGTPDSPDVAAARRVAAHLGTDHHELLYTADEALAALPRIVRSIESSSAPRATCSRTPSRRASPTPRSRPAAARSARRCGTKEEFAYYRLWRAHLERVRCERTLSRFARA